MNYLLNVDFLEFRANSQILLNNFLSNGIYKISNVLSLERIKDYSPYRNIYPFCFRIRYKDDDIGLFWAKTLDLSLTRDLNILVKIDNKIFYVYCLTAILKVLVEALGLTKILIKRIDVCYDTDTDVLTRFKTLFYETSTKFRLRNKIKVKGTGKDDDELTIGSLKSRTKCISIYNKTKEINSSHKEYIRNLHKEIFGQKFIYRVEMRLMNKTMEIKDIDIMRLEDTDYLETIFNTYFDNLVQFSDMNTNEKIDFITLNNTGEKLQRAVKQKNQCGGKQVKTIINFLDKEIETKEFRGKKTNWKLLRSALIVKYGLDDWYLIKIRG